MKPVSLSASSVSNFETCPAMWAASSVAKAPEGRKPAADLGSACHNALEEWVVNDFAFDESNTLELLTKIYDAHYHDLFGDDGSRLDEGRDMIKTWYKRTHPLTNEVLSVEVKQNFEIKWPDGDVIPFNYIFDRLDKHDDGSIEVVDYKTISFPLSPDMMREKFQVRAYGLATQILYPEAPGIWITYDMLRHDPVSVYLKKEDNAETWNYLKNVVKRIDAEDEDAPTERVNELCRWCPRKHVCETLKRHTDVGGVHGVITDPVMAANRRAELDMAKKAITSQIEDLDLVILTYMQNEDLLEFETDDYVVKATAQGRRSVDANRVKKIVPPDVFDDYGYEGMSLKEFDKMLKDDRVDRDTALQLKGLISKSYSSPSVKTIQKRDEDE